MLCVLVCVQDVLEDNDLDLHQQILLQHLSHNLIKIYLRNFNQHFYTELLLR
jgi:hypothetical protein